MNNIKVSLLGFLLVILLAACDSSDGGFSIGDDTPPSDITDLAFNPETRVITWTAPGDNGDSGKARVYDVRLLEDTQVADILGVPDLNGVPLATIQEAVRDNFGDAIQVPDEPEADDAGSQEKFLLTRIDIDGTKKYYASVIARDEVGNESDPSNVVEVSSPLVFTEYKNSAGGSCFGESIASGDFNDDQINDLAVGDPCAGMVFIFYGDDEDLIDGSADGDGFYDVGAGDTADVTIIGSAAEGFGASVAGIQDVQGDPSDELVIGAPDADGGRGKVYYIIGDDEKPTVINLTASDEPNGVITGEAAGDHFGFSLADGSGILGSGRVVIIGAPNANSNTGKVYLFRATAIGSNTSAGEARATFIGEAAGNMFGFSVDRAGNIDDDSTEDLAVGAPGAGKAYVVFGSEEISGVQNLASDKTRVVVIQGSGQFGFSVSGGGDLNDPDLDVNDEDERDDLLVGAPDGDGTVFVYEGQDIEDARTSGLNPPVLTQINGAGGDFGTSVALLSDINADIETDDRPTGPVVDFEQSNGDIAVGAPGLSTVYIFFGRPNMPAVLSAAQADVTLPTAVDPAPGAGFGTEVIDMGDVNLKTTATQDNTVNDLAVAGTGFVRLEF